MPRKNQVMASAPATVANLGPGFDRLGVALEYGKDQVSAAWGEKTELEVCGEISGLPQDPKKNIVGIVAVAMLRKAGVRRPVRLRLKKGIPVASGLGGSAASAVATAVAVNRLLGKPFSPREILEFALIGEKAVSGAAHCDNVLPSLFGGICLAGRGLSGTLDPSDFRSVSFSPQLRLVLLHPHIRVETRRARKLVPKIIPQKIGALQEKHLADLLWAVEENRFEAGRNYCVDLIAEPKRAKLIPHFLEIRNAALKAGAFGSSIAGSGPTLFALTDRRSAKKVMIAMRQAWKSKTVSVDCFISPIRKEGAW